MSNIMANRLAAPVRNAVPTCSLSRSFVQKPATLLRPSERSHSCRDVRMRAGTDDVGSAYANALVELAQEKNALNDIHEDVESLVGVFNEDKNLKDFLTNPVVTEEKKKEVLQKIAKEAKYTDYFLNFLNILIDQDRLVSADDIFNAFEQRYCELTDTQVATIYSAVKLEQEQQFLVAKKLQELTGSKNIKLKTVIDDSLIAGFSVDFGSAQIDLSIRGQLEDVAQELVAGATSLDIRSPSSSSNNNNGPVDNGDLQSDEEIEKEVEEEFKAKEAALA